MVSGINPLFSFFLVSSLIKSNSLAISNPAIALLGSIFPNSDSRFLVIFCTAFSKSCGVTTIPGPFRGTDNGIVIIASISKIFTMFGICSSNHSVS